MTPRAARPTLTVEGAFVKTTRRLPDVRPVAVLFHEGDWKFWYWKGEVDAAA